MALPRLERGEGDAEIHVVVPPWKELGPMLRSVVEGVKETGEPVLSTDNVEPRLVGFHMTQLDGDDIRSWTWEIHIDDLRRCLATPEWGHLAELWKTATGRAHIAATLSEGKLP